MNSQDHNSLALVSPCGWGNLGDAAILDSLIHAIRRRRPEDQIIAFTLNAEDTTRRHGVPAYPCAGYSLPHYALDGVPGIYLEPLQPFASRESVVGHGVSGFFKRAAGAIPYLIPLHRRVKDRAKRNRLDAAFGEATASRLKNCQRIIVAGGGQLDEFWGGPWGHPYSLWRFARFSRAIGADYQILSVGVGSLTETQSREYVRSALETASYRSYRDVGSRELLKDFPFTSDDPVVPDLAFSLPVSASKKPSQSEHVKIGVSPIAYCDPRVWPIKDNELYRNHVQTMARLSARLLEAGHVLKFFPTDIPDMRTIADIRGVLSSLCPVDQLDRAHVAEVIGVSDLMQFLNDCDVAIASRLHAVILSHVARLPVFAVAYDRKVSQEMNDIGHKLYTTDIDTLSPEDVWPRVQQLIERRAELATEIDARVGMYAMALENQYDRTIGAPQ